MAKMCHPGMRSYKIGFRTSSQAKKLHALIPLNENFMIVSAVTNFFPCWPP